MDAIIILIFVLGYLTIVFEHPLKLDKTIPALLMATLIWGILALGFHNGWLRIISPSGETFSLLSGGEQATEGLKSTMLHHFGKTAEILVFLIGAMTIVEIIDLHKGFDILKRTVRTKSKRKLLWIIGIISFCLSAVIDNLTATIVLVTLTQKLIPSRKERLWYVSLIIIAANAGGAWSPIGDVTTTMLWIGGKLTAGGLIEYVVFPAVICFLIPFLIASNFSVFKGRIDEGSISNIEDKTLRSSKTMLFVGIGMIITVPISKTFLHLPPYLGMALALAVVCFISSYIKPEKNMTAEKREKYSIQKALSKIDMNSILFFLGILMAVAGLEALVFGAIKGQDVGTLRYLAESLQQTIPNQNYVVVLLGFLSAIVDNVPLVAASMGMYSLPLDHEIWHFVAYSAGTGGSMLIIGSAAGVAAMGMEKIDFIWYLKKISWLAVTGFIAGALTFMLVEGVLF